MIGCTGCEGGWRGGGLRLLNWLVSSHEILYPSMCEMLLNARNKEQCLFLGCYLQGYRVQTLKHATTPYSCCTLTTPFIRNVAWFTQNSALFTWNDSCTIFIWNGLHGLKHFKQFSFILYYCTVYCGPDVIWWYFIVTIPVHIELTIYSQIVNNACMFTYSFKTNVSINLSIIRSTDVIASRGVIVFVNFCFIFIL